MATPNCVNDIVLEHLIVVSKGAGGNCKGKCRYCEKEFTGSQTRQLAHVAGIRGQGVSICGDIGDDKRDAVNMHLARFERIKQSSRASTSGSGL